MSWPPYCRIIYHPSSKKYFCLEWEWKWLGMEILALENEELEWNWNGGKAPFGAALILADFKNKIKFENNNNNFFSIKIKENYLNLVQLTLSIGHNKVLIDQ